MMLLSRRENCCIIYSDNAKTFKCANKDFDYFDKIIKDKKLQDFASSERISWKFIVELSPWWGGFYESLMKEPLRKILGGAQLTFETYDHFVRNGECPQSEAFDLCVQRC